MIQNNRGITVAVIGAGSRGVGYARYFLSNPVAGKVVAVADPDSERLKKLSDQHFVHEVHRYANYQAFFEQPKMCDAVLICTMDQQHYEPTMMALEKGYHVMVEKPMSPDPIETLDMSRQADNVGKILMVGHVLRYSPFFYKIKSLLHSGAIGDVISIDLIENVGHIHYSHSFVRGNWGNSRRSSFMLMSKSCHDIDILHWLIDKPCVKVSSFGSLMHFNSNNAPEGSTANCFDGCIVERSCPYSANRIYVERGEWLWQVTQSERKEDRIRALQEGPYGRCVYRCDNDVVDHQVVSMEFETGITASFTMIAFTTEEYRTIKVFGTKGQLRSHMGKNEIVVSTFNGDVEKFNPATHAGGHFGADPLLVEDFVTQVNSGHVTGGRTHAKTSADSHLITFAAEQARLQGEVVEMAEYVSNLSNRLSSAYIDNKL
ncbi:Gfo/Idh/MocA family protein [Paenibacillus chungangensis]|uniref:Gfo/Idh/MocA family protein n=1 Tax=Paenibacillus chungangensis TaxID=696535 RepID=A0ABW3HTN4_9BACL